MLRQPLEGQPREISISRASGTITFPAHFMLIAAQNPCPCGYYGDATQTCTCSNAMMAYPVSLSEEDFGAVDVTAAIAWTFTWRCRECRADAGEKLSADRRGEPSAVVRERVEAARAFHRIQKLARTIADLADEEEIQPAHLTEGYLSVAGQDRPRG